MYCFENVCRKFEDIFDVDHFIDYLKDDVRIVRDIPEWFTDRTELFSSIRLNVLFLSLMAEQFFIFFLLKMERM